MARMLVTGASGFTGSALCRRLCSDGHDVVAFVRPSSDTKMLQDMGVECREVDIRDSDDVLKNFEDFRNVYHIAAAYRAEHVDKEEFTRVNVGATKNLLEAAKAKGIHRFVHCSTVGVQGEIEQPPADEDYRLQPGDHYQQSKLEGELLAREYFDAGLPGVVVRPVGIFGPGDMRFLKLFRPVSRGQFVMIGRGDVLYHLTYIDDLVQGIVLAGEHPGAVGEVFTIAGEQYSTIRELVDLIAEVLGKPKPRLRVPFLPVYWASVVCDKVCSAVGVSPPLYPRRVEFFQLDRAFTISKARELLGYEPSVSLREGIGRTAAWYQEQGLL